MSRKLHFTFLLYFGLNIHYITGDILMKKWKPVSSKPVIENLPTFFTLIFSTPLENRTDSQEYQLTEDLYRNALNIQYSTLNSSNLASSISNFVITLSNFSKTDKKLYELSSFISSEVGSHKDIHNNLMNTLNSFLQNSNHVNSQDYSNEVNQVFSDDLIYALSNHLQMDYKSIKMPKIIKEQHILKNKRVLRNAATLAMLSSKLGNILNCLAKIFVASLNRTTQMDELYKVANCMKEAYGQVPSLNDYINARREVHAFTVKYLSPEPKDKDIEIVRATFVGIPVIISQPTQTTDIPFPALVYIHGGGWVYRTPDQYLPQTVYLAKALNIMVISVDYRRSPEFPFPIPVEDCLKVTKYLLENGTNYNVNPKEIGIIGDSAGGNMAAAVSLMLRDYYNITLKMQVLIYPCLQMLDFNLPSYQRNKETIGLHQSDMADFYLLYTNLSLSYRESLLNNKLLCENTKKSIYGSFINIKNIPWKYRKTYVKVETECDPSLANTIKHTTINPYIFPLMSKDLSKLPPTFITVGENDILLDDSLLFIGRLRMAGVIVKEDIYNDGYHGMIDHLNQVKLSKEVLDKIVKFVKTNFLA